MHDVASGSTSPSQGSCSAAEAASPASLAAAQGRTPDSLLFDHNVPVYPYTLAASSLLTFHEFPV